MRGGAFIGVRTVLVAAIASALATCAVASSASVEAVTVTEVTQGLASAPNPGAPTAGPDGNVWFTDNGAVGRITPAGAITEFTQGIPPGDTPSDSITTGSDGALWFCLSGTSPAIGRLDPASGAITSFPLTSNPQSVVEGPDGNVWFIGGAGMGTAAIGYITPAGAVTEITTGFNTVGASPEAITAGPDGNIWFLDDGSPYSIGHVDLKVTPHTLSETATGVNPTDVLGDITAGPDGNLWFTASGAIGTITLPAASVTETVAGTDGLQAGAEPDEIMAGPDQNVWFDDQQSGADAIGRIVPATGAIIEFPLTTASVPWTMAFAIDGNLYVDQTGRVAQMTTAGMDAEFPTPSSMAGTDNDSMVPGPDGNIYYNDLGTPKALVQVNLHEKPAATTGAASAITDTSATVTGSVTPLGADTTVSVLYGPTTALGSTAAAGTLRANTAASSVSAQLVGLPASSTIYYEVVATNANGTTTAAMATFMTAVSSAPPPLTRASRPTIITAHVGDQLLTLTTPSTKTCLASTTRLAATLLATASQGTQPRLHLVKVTFSLDRGIRHVRHRYVRKNGRRHRERVITYTPNAIVHRSPATVSLPLATLRHGAHALHVLITFDRTLGSGQRRHTTVKTKAITARFSVC